MIRLLPLLLAGCAMTPLQGNRDMQTVTITWYTENVQAECYHLLGRDAYGCAKWKGDTCTIWSPEPLGQEDDMAKSILGHETLHCFRGAWH